MISVTRGFLAVSIPVVACLYSTTLYAQNAGNIERGQQAFTSCSACHQVGQNAKNAFGPVLTNIVGRDAGVREGYVYSESLSMARDKGLVWSAEQLNEWLSGPTEFLQQYLGVSSASSKMPVRIDDPQTRADIIAYLASITDDTKGDEMSHGSAPHSEKVRLMTGEPDDIDKLPRQKLELVKPPFFPPHTQKASGGPKIVEVELTVTEKKWVIDNKGTEIVALTYEGSIPGPLIVVHQDDYVELTLKNPSHNLMEHNIDLHAATGALGGAAITTIVPGEEAVLRFKADKAGAFLYHCAPEGSMTPYHVTHGMTGAILVLPRDGLKDGEGNDLTYDRGYFIGENDFYVPRDEDGEFKRYETAGEDLIDWIDAMHTLTPSHIVFNGRVGALTGEGAMTANVGEQVLFLHMQGNRDTRPHMIGGHGDYVWPLGSFSLPPVRDAETWFVPGGSVGAAMVEFRQPGIYAYLNHNLIEAVEFGAAAHVVVDGEWNDEIMKQVYLGPIRE